MNRRRGVPCGCDADPCGCSPKNHCVKAINNVSPDPNGDLTLTPGDHIVFTEGDHEIEISADIPANSMVYRGTVGTGGTIASLPPASSDNQGDVYIAVSAASSPVVYEIGDVVISNGSTWEVIPSGDEIVPIVTAWQSPPDDAHVPSEKLVKNSLDGKIDSWEGRPGYEHTNLVYAMYDGSDTPMNWTNSTAANLNFAVYHENGELYVADPVHNRDAANKQYVDNAIAGVSPSITWTQRTANNDWTDLFDIEANNSLTAKKTILLKMDGVTILDAIIPKGYNKTVINLIGYRAYPVYPPNTTLTLFKQLSIKASNVVSSASNIDNQSYNMTATVNGTNVEFTLLTSSGSDAKSNFKIYTLD